MQYTAPLRYPFTVVTIHDVVYRNPAWVSRKFHYWYRFLIPRVVAKARRVVTVSEFSKSEIMKTLGVPEARLAVVHGAASTDFARYAAAADDNPHGRYVLGAATMNQRKNFAGLVRAFLATADHTVKLILVGGADPAVYGRDSALAGQLRSERIVLAGYVSDEELAGLYRHALLFAFPSLYEGFGIPPIEAMSVGCPVLTSNTSSLPEICGDAARLVDPTDDAAITAAIDELLSDEAARRELSQRGFERARRYDWHRSAARFSEIAHEVLAELAQVDSRS